MIFCRAFLCATLKFLLLFMKCLYWRFWFSIYKFSLAFLNSCRCSFRMSLWRFSLDSLYGEARKKNKKTLTLHQRKDSFRSFALTVIKRWANYLNGALRLFLSLCTNFVYIHQLPRQRCRLLKVYIFTVLSFIRNVVAFLFFFVFRVN